MRAGRAALLLALVTVAVLACDGDDDTRPKATPIATTPASAATPAEVTPSLPPESPTPTPTPSPAPLTGIPRNLPAGTRTGIPIVDAVIEAFEKDDAAAIERLVKFDPRPCSLFPMGKFPRPPECWGNEAEATPVDVVGLIFCGGMYARPEELYLEGYLRSLGPHYELYAVFESPNGDPAWPPGRYTAIFSHPIPEHRRADAIAVRMDDDGVTGIAWNCLGEGPHEAYYRFPGRAIAAPVDGPPARPQQPPGPAGVDPVPVYPIGTRTGHLLADQVLELVESRNGTGLAALAQFAQLPCVYRPVYPFGRPKCPYGTREGTAVDAIPATPGTPSVLYLNEGQLRTFLARLVEHTRGLHSLYEIWTGSPPLLPEGGYGLVLAIDEHLFDSPSSYSLEDAADADALLISLDQAGIAGIRVLDTPREAVWKASEFLLPPVGYQALEYGPFNDGQLRLEAFQIYRLLRKATEQAPCETPCGARDFPTLVRRAIQRCDQYRAGEVVTEPGYWGNPPPPEAVAAFERGCGRLEDALATVGPPDETPEWVAAAVEARVIFGAAPGSLPRLRMGDTVVVNTHGDDRMILRDGPGLAYAELQRVPSGTQLRIAGGPTGTDGLWWWRIDWGAWAADANLEYAPRSFSFPTAPTPTPTPSATARPVTGLFYDLRFRPPDEFRALGQAVSGFQPWDGVSTVIYDTVTGEEINLGVGNLASFSPDGRRAAWAAGSPLEVQQIRVIDLVDRSQRSLGSGRTTSWLDDRRLLAYLPASNERVVIDVDTGERRDALPADLAPEAPAPPLFRTVDGYVIHRFGGDLGHPGTVRIYDSSGTPVIEFRAYLVRPAGPGEVVIATGPREGFTNLFIVNIPRAEAFFVATAKWSPPNWPLAAGADYVAWTEDYCAYPGGKTRLFERSTGRLIELDQKLWVGMTPAGLLTAGEFGAGALIDPRTLEYVAVIPGRDANAETGSAGDVSWSPDYRYASHGYAGGHGGLC